MLTEESPTPSIISRIKRLLVSRREEIIENQYYEIKRLESKYRKLYDSSPLMCRTINTEGIILDCNQTYLENLGYSAKEVIGHSIFEHAPKEHISALRESFEQWKRTGIVINKEVWYERKDGSVFPALINANNLYDDNGKLIGSNTVITDMTEIHKARKELERAHEEMKKAYEMKKQFIDIAAHELRTPIHPILLCAGIAKESNEKKEAWDVVLRCARRLKKLVDDILDVSRMESDDIGYDFEQARINEIIIEVANHARLMAADQIDTSGNSIVTIETKLDDDLELLLDKTRIAQALTNILENSVKFTVEGRITIETSILAQKKLIEIKIADTGTGIPQDMLPKLFEKFVTRTSGNDDLNKHGAGLGLFIARSIIQAHGGDIFAYNNNDGKGATFVIRLPIR